MLEEAKAAVGNIKKDNLNEIRSLKLPPEPIRDVLEGVLRLMNNQVPTPCYPLLLKTLKVGAVWNGTVLNLRTTTLQKCAAVLRRARIQGS